MRTVNKETKEKFIKAMIAEMQEHGITDFSLRRVSSRCGTTSGAPYRHFKDKNDAILEVLKYINNKWYEIQDDIIQKYPDDYRKQLVDMCINYISFLHEYPEFQTILMLNDSSMTSEQRKEKGYVSMKAAETVDKYCQSVNMSEQDRTRKLFIVRSLIFGGALMLNSGVMPFCESTIEMIRASIDREFDLE